MKYLILVLSSILLFAACDSEKKSGHAEQIQKLISENKYNEALQYISSVPSTEETQKLAIDIRQKNQQYLTNLIADAKNADLTNQENQKVLAKAHVDMGIFLEYYGDHLEMRERMTTALAHFRKALQLEPTNAKAQAEKAQIEGIYQQMGRPVPDGIAD